MERPRPKVGWNLRAIEQPNDKFAVFDVGPGDFIDLNLEQIDRAVGKGNPDNWKDALERVRRFKSRERYAEILKLVC
jgi:hypothetical protein